MGRRVETTAPAVGNEEDVSFGRVSSAASGINTNFGNKLLAEFLGATRGTRGQVGGAEMGGVVLPPEEPCWWSGAGENRLQQGSSKEAPTRVEQSHRARAVSTASNSSKR